MCQVLNKPSVFEVGGGPVAIDMLDCFHFFGILYLLLALQPEFSAADPPLIGQIHPGLRGSPNTWIDNGGFFLVSNSSTFAFGFSVAQVYGNFQLTVVHRITSRIVWTANRGSTVGISDNFVFDTDGNVYLVKEQSVIWSPNTAGKGVTAMELQDSGNLVLLGNDGKPLWQSFSHPTDTLLSNQVFSEGMRLTSNPNHSNMHFYLELKSGDALLYGGLQSPHPYWSISDEWRKVIRSSNKIISAALNSNSWNFYDQNQTLVWQFIFAVADKVEANFTPAAVLESDGYISFYNLEDGASVSAAPIRIPQDACSTPGRCDSYYICRSQSRGNSYCTCLPVLRNYSNCSPGIVSPCNSSSNSTELIDAGGQLEYAPLRFMEPLPNLDLNRCKGACLSSCSCVMLFFHINSGNCFLLDQIGSMQKQNELGPSRYLSYIKVSTVADTRLKPEGKEGIKQKHFLMGVCIVTPILIVLCSLLCCKFWHGQRDRDAEAFQDVLDENYFFSHCLGEKSREYLPYAPICFSYKYLESATRNFSMKLGQGGFGSVYKGILPDGTWIAVKKLESIAQGKKEFQAEVTTIGSIRHIHLVRLRGFCAEGTNRLLAYDYMAKGSLDKRIFKNREEGLILNWDTRFNIALGIAKGLSYLHHQCCIKVVHCDIKPENVLLDDNYQAKVSDFGLAKLMTREQSQVFTTLRGTRGYLAPEWITNHAISDKTDVYSFGIVLLEIIGGRRNFEPKENLEKAHLPSYAIKMVEEGTLKKIIDPRLDINKDDERVNTAVKVALWCIQGNMNLRPSMSKVVQMLEGLCDTPLPPSFAKMGSCFFANFVTPIGCGVHHSETNHTDMQLSGPR